MCLGTKSHEETHFFRVSTDRWFLVLKVQVSENALNEQKAFYKTIQKLPMAQRELLQYHTKFAARKMSVGKLTGRDGGKTVEIEQRIPLPFACEHEFATNLNDPFFMVSNTFLMTNLVRSGLMLNLFNTLKMVMLVGMVELVLTWRASMRMRMICFLILYLQRQLQERKMWERILTWTVMTISSVW